MADGARGVRGCGAPGREKPNEFLSDTQKTTTTHHLSLQELQKSWTQPRDWEGSSLFKGEIASKRTRWLRSRSQSPRPIWRPNSAKANACAQPAPHFSRSRSSRKKTAATRQSRSRIYKPGALAARSCTPGRMPTKGALSSSWSPYSLSSAAIASPTSQEINERFLQTLAEGAVGRSLIEMSPYEKELARLRLERLHMEEEWLLELKRQQELERTRGPKPKWYEMKSSQFHYEAHKNNQLLRSSQDLQSMYNYRRELESASKEFQEHSKPTHLASL